MTNHPRRRRGYAHGEAFCLMTYRADDGSEEEVIWNSRDGVTPFVITLRSGTQARHVDWHRDQRAPDFKPPPGMRVFVDLTPARAREQAEANVDRFWVDPEYGAGARKRYGTKAAMARALAKSYLETPGAPDLIEVAPR